MANENSTPGIISSFLKVLDDAMVVQKQQKEDEHDLFKNLEKDLENERLKQVQNDISELGKTINAAISALNEQGFSRDEALNIILTSINAAAK